MTRSSPPELLAATRFCDHHSFEVAALAERVSSASAPAEVARAAFRVVRDQIVFGLDLWQVAASATLAKGYGMCSNKALLLIALLRHRGIPARLAWVPMKAAALAPAIGLGSRLLPAEVNHVIAQVELDGRWLALDLTLDRVTFDRFFSSRVRWEIDWDGQGDHLIFREHLLGPVQGPGGRQSPGVCGAKGGPVASDDIDATLLDNAGNRIPPRLIAAPFLQLANHRMWWRLARANGLSATAALANQITMLGRTRHREE